MISRICYVVAALAFLAGGAGAGMVVWSGISALDQGMIRIVAPGTSVLALSEPGAYTIYHEPESVIDGKIYSAQNINGLRVAVAEEGGEQVTVTTPAVTSRYSIGGRSGVSVLGFEIAHPGRYRLTAAYGAGRSEPVTVLAISQGFVGRLVMTIFGAIGSAFAGVGAGLTIALVTYFRRRRMLRAAGARLP
jgi:hypothetical protein